MKCVLGFSLFLASVSAPAAVSSVEVANNDFAWLPTLESRGTFGLTPEAITTIHALVIDGNCKLAGQTKRDLDITVPFAVHYASDGSLEKL